MDGIAHLHSKFRLVIIVAVAKNRVIGLNGKMPWHIPSELKAIKERTMDRPMIMGRKTFESIGKPLVGRKNIVLTRQDWQYNGCDVAHSPQNAIAIAEKWIQRRKDGKRKTRKEIIIFGGGEIYKMFLPFANEVEETLIDIEPEGDTYFDKDRTLERSARDWWPIPLSKVDADGRYPGYTRTLYRKINHHGVVPEYLSQAAAG